jgi:enoyl-CoA hydratase
MAIYQEILTLVEEGILTIIINRPQALNALNKGVFDDLIQLFTKDIDPTKYKGVIITGAGGKAFAAGADIKEFLGLDQAKAKAQSQRGQDIFATIETFSIPVIAAVNGFALGGGCELAMACHMRIAHAKSRFGQPEVNLGILPGYGGTQRLIQLIGKGKAIELLLTADMINVEQALTLGLVNHVVAPDELISKSKEIINKIAQKAPLAIAETINVVNDYFDETKDGYNAEVEAFGRLAESKDFVEGASAFIEKRVAEWKRE